MVINPLILALAAVIPTITGFIWYNPKVFGTAWMEASGMTEEKMKGANMALIFGLSFLLSFFLAMGMMGLSIHQNAIFSALNGDESEAALALLAKFAEGGEYAMNFRSFGHGVVHGIVGGIMFALPMLGTNALFERKGFKYIAINVGYWIITMALMGGVICQFS